MNDYTQTPNSDIYNYNVIYDDEDVIGEELKMNKLEELRNEYKLKELRNNLGELEHSKYKIEKEIENVKKAIYEAEQGDKEIRPYELVYMMKPNSTAKEIGKVENIIKDIVTNKNLKKENIKQYEHLGVKKLAYEVYGNKEGYYVIAKLKMTNQDLILVEKELRRAECVLKFITIRIDEEEWEEYDK